MKRKVTLLGFVLAAATAVWGSEQAAVQGLPRVGGEVEISSLPFDINEVIRTVRENSGLPEEPPRQGFQAETQGEEPFAQEGEGFAVEAARFRAEVDEDGLRYFTQGRKGQPDFKVLSVSFEQGGFSQTVFGEGCLLGEHLPGLLQGEVRGGVTPYARNRGEEGIEIYWTIDEPLGPEASALLVRLAIRAAGEPQGHPEGLVFPAWQEEGQVTLSNVTVVDSAGRREIVRPSLATGREILFEVSHEFLENAQYPILIDPTVGPEFPAEPSPVYVPAANDQRAPSVASNGTDYFVVWEDSRGADMDIYGARVASDGTVLDPAGIAVSTAASFQRAPSVASNGTGYFVAWEDWRSGTGFSDIYGARVAGGTVLDPAGIAVSTAVDWQDDLSVASNGTDYFVTWQDYRSGTNYDIYGARVQASDGLLLDGPPATGGIEVSTEATHQFAPSAASNGTDYFVAWVDYRNDGGCFCNMEIYGARVTEVGALLPNDPLVGIAVSTAVNNQRVPSVASNGTDYFVVWEDWRNGSIDRNIYGTRVDSEGVVLNPTPTDIAVSTVAASDQQDPSVASNGTDYFVAWDDWRNGSTDRNIYGTRVDSEGVVLDPTPTDIAVSTAADNQKFPSVASNGTDYFVAWEDYRSGTDYDIYGTRVASFDGEVLDDPLAGILVSTVASVQSFPSVASNGTGYFIAWEDWRNDDQCSCNRDIYGARVTSEGMVLDPAGIAVSTAPNDQLFPSVASNGTDYFVAWEDWRNGGLFSDIYGRRVTLAGTVLDDPVGIAVSTAANNQEYPSAASNGTDYFVAWHDFRSGADYDIYGTRVTSAGTVDDPLGIAVSTAASVQWFPSAASNGTDYFVAWDDYRSGSYDIYGARVTSAGTVDDPLGIAVSTAANNQEFASVASNGADYFIAWQDYRSGANWDIYGRRVTSAGAVLDDPLGIAVSTAANVQWLPSAASNGTDYFVAWQDNRSGTDDIYGARVTSAAGTVLDAAGVLIQQSLYDDQVPAVAYAACGKYLFAYQRFNDAHEFGAYRVMARVFYDGLETCGISEVSAPSGIAPLLPKDVGGGQVEIWWEDHSELFQYNIYEGDLNAPFYTHLSVVCWTAGTTEPLTGYLSAVVTPSYVDSYFLVTECDTSFESTSGYDSAAVERNPLLNTCGPHP